MANGPFALICVVVQPKTGAQDKYKYIIYIFIYIVNNRKDDSMNIFVGIGFVDAGKSSDFLFQIEERLKMFSAVIFYLKSLSSVQTLVWPGFEVQRWLQGECRWGCSQGFLAGFVLFNI